VSWARDQIHFERRIFSAKEGRHFDSSSLFRHIRNSVGKQGYQSAAGRYKRKLLGGGTGATVTVSHDARKQKAYIDANQALRTADNTLTIKDLCLSWHDEKIVGWCKLKAKRCTTIAENSPVPALEIRLLLRDYTLDIPQFDLFGLDGAIARACDELWWRKQVRVLKVRRIDQLARSFRMVHAKAAPYCSDEGVQLRRAQTKRNRALLESMEAINQEGTSYTLAELSDLSTSNPVNRRNELMVRMRGFENVADELRHAGLFVTLNCPSRFHPMRQIRNKNGDLVRVVTNDKYDGSTPRDAQDWLCKTWALIRAEMGRDCMRCYGFRVVEPHHDGCPHWHALLFATPGEIIKLQHLFQSHALRTDADEAGAREHRVKLVPIDKNKGSATGYIAKYICKNIDGSHIDSDMFGNAGVTAAERICAWASTWGIRQFQQIGGPSVTVWRELRRLDSEEGGRFEAIREAASDCSDWAAYCMLMGGPFVRRDAQAVRVARWHELELHEDINYASDVESGQLKQVPNYINTGAEKNPSCNKYGESSVGTIFGLIETVTQKHYLTRFYSWSVSRIGAVENVLKESVAKVRQYVEDQLTDVELDFLRGAAACSTGSPVALEFCQ